MCGFCGEIRFDGLSVSLSALKRMCDVLAPRGPDGEGALSRGPIGLAHRRLKIFDRSERSQQPLVDPELGLSIAYNGAIYNYRELREELRGRGYRFFSEGDTEVLLKAFHAWGEECVERLHGMFAFAIWDRDAGRLTLGRDPLGIKPLYLSETPERLRFASTLPALLAGGGIDTDIDPVGLHHYLTFHSAAPAPRTVLAGVRKVPPATTVTVSLDGGRRERTYWSMEPDPAGEELDEESWTARVADALRTSVGRRLVADVPVGVLLSGGLDSSLVVALLASAGQQGLRTFSIGFESVGDEEGDEFRYSDRVAAEFGTRHERIFVEGARALETLPACVRAMSEPMTSHDTVGFFLLSQEVSRHISVVQSGQGADEVFAGYHWYPPLMESEDALRDYARVFFDRGHGELLEAVHARFHGPDHSTELVAAHLARPGASRAIDRVLRLDTTVMLVDDPVKRVDNMTMAFGLEARVPFLDRELVELAARVPAELKVGGGGKAILKRVARGLLPDEVIDRPKGYFPVPALKYLRGPFLAMARDVLESPEARRRAVFEPSYVRSLLERPEEHITPLRGSKVWQLALLELWLQQHGIAA